LEPGLSSRERSVFAGDLPSTSGEADPSERGQASAEAHTFEVSVDREFNQSPIDLLLSIC